MILKQFTGKNLLEPVELECFSKMELYTDSKALKKGLEFFSFKFKI